MQFALSAVCWEKVEKEKSMTNGKNGFAMQFFERKKFSENEKGFNGVIKFRLDTHTHTFANVGCSPWSPALELPRTALMAYLPKRSVL